MGHPSASRHALRPDLGRVSGRRCIGRGGHTALRRLGFVGARADLSRAGGVWSPEPWRCWLTAPHRGALVGRNEVRAPPSHPEVAKNRNIFLRRKKS